VPVLQKGGSIEGPINPSIVADLNLIRVCLACPEGVIKLMSVGAEWLRPTHTIARSHASQASLITSLGLRLASDC